MQIHRKLTYLFTALAGGFVIVLLVAAFFAPHPWVLVALSLAGIAGLYVSLRMFSRKIRPPESVDQMRKKLEDTYREQKDFISNSSHELRTPLTSITGQIEVALMQDRTSSEYQQVLQSLLEDIRNLNMLTNRLLMLTRSAGSIPSDRKTNVRIDDLLWRSVAEIGKRNPEYQVQIHFDPSIEGEQHFTIKGNEQLLITALNNILENGCKYSSEQRVDVSLSVEEDNIRLNFTDRGIGIPSDEIDLIFQPFYRASNVKKRGGHGIGLSLVQKIIRAHGGSISMFSELNKGTRVSLILPLVHAC